MIAAYVESLKLRVGTFIGMAAVLGYLATVPSAPASRGLSLPGLVVLFVVTVIAAGGAGALNHFLDRDLDARMPRTARRPLPSGRIRHPWHMVALGGGLVGLAVSLALWKLHPLVALHVFLGAFTYVVVYTIWLKRRTWLNVVIGGLAGSFAVMAGGSLARPELCLPPVLFALVLFFWSPSHFWSLAIAYKQEYVAARIPMLPAVKGEAGTARGILVNTTGLLTASLLPFALGLLGWPYLGLGVLGGGSLLLVRNIQLVRHPTDRRLALRNFHASNLFLLLLFLGVVLDVVVRRW
jgi:protoheme IX farnesyltransferase